MSNLTAEAAKEIVEELDRRALLNESRGDRPIESARVAEMVAMIEPFIRKHVESAQHLNYKEK